MSKSMNGDFMKNFKLLHSIDSLLYSKSSGTPSFWSAVIIAIGILCSALNTLLLRGAIAAACIFIGMELPSITNLVHILCSVGKEAWACVIR